MISGGNGEELFFVSIEVLIVQDHTIKYMKWELEWLDILKRPIVFEYPVYVRRETVLGGGKQPPPLRGPSL